MRLQKQKYTHTHAQRQKEDKCIQLKASRKTDVRSHTNQSTKLAFVAHAMHVQVTRKKKHTESNSITDCFDYNLIDIGSKYGQIGKGKH